MQGHNKHFKVESFIFIASLYIVLGPFLWGALPTKEGKNLKVFKMRWDIKGHIMIIEETCSQSHFPECKNYRTTKRKLFFSNNNIKFHRSSKGFT